MSAGGRGTYSIRVNLDASQAISALGQLRTQLGGLGASFTTSSGQINQAAMSFTRFGAEAQRAVGTSSALAGSIGQLRGPLAQFNTQLNTASTGLPRLANAQQQAAAASKQNAQAMQNQIQRMTAMGSRIGGIAFMFTGLTAAMGEAQGMSELLTESQKKLEAEQAKAADAIQKYGENSFQATRALEAVEKAERAVAFQSRITTLSIQDQFFFIGGLASIALPSVIQAFGKLNQAMKAAQAAGQGFGAALTASFASVGTRFTGIINALTGGLNALVPSFARVSTAAGAAATSTAANTTVLSTYTVATGAATAATTRFGVALTGLLRHPVVLVLAALATAFVVLQQNVGGVTDGIRQFGITLGQAFPVLQPLLNLIDGIAASLGIMGDATVDAGERFASAAEGFANIGTLWHDTLATMQQSENEFVRFFGNLGVIVSDGVVAAGEALQRFGEGLAQAPARIGAAFGEVGGLIEQSLQGAGAAFDQFIQGVSQIPGRIGEALGAVAGQFQSNIITPLQNAFGGFLEWLRTNVWDPIVNGFNNIASFIGPVAEQIAQALGLDQLANWVIQTVIPAIGDAFNQIVGFVQPIGSALYEALHIADLLTLATQVAQGVVDAFNAIPSFVQNIGQQLWDTLGFGWLQEQLQGFFDWIATNLGGIGGEAPGGMSFGELAMKGIMNEEQLKAFEEATKFKPTPFQPTAPTQESTFGGLGSVSEQQRRQMQGGQIPITLPIAPERGGPTGFETIGAGLSEFVQQQARDLELSTAGMGPGPITPASMPMLAAIRQAREEQKTLSEEAQQIWADYVKFQDPAKISTQEFERAMSSLQDTQGFNDETVSILSEAHKAYTQVLRDGGTETEALAARDAVLNSELAKTVEATEQATSVLGEMKTQTKDMATTLQQTAEAARTGALTTQMQTQGMHEAAQAALDYGAELEKSTAFNQRWGEIIETSAFKAAAFETGVQKQVKALQDQKVSLMENEGVLAQYAAQVASGEAGQLAFTKGVQDQQKALLDSRVALEETRGQLETYAQQLASGEQQAVAFAEGQQAVQQSFLDMIRSVSEIQGQISEYDRLLADGRAQTIAFAEGLERGRLAARELQVEIAASNGEMQGFRQGLLETIPAFETFFDTTVYSGEQLKEFALIALGSREAIMSLADTFAQAAQGFGDSIKDIDWRDIDNNLDDAIEETHDSLDELFEFMEKKGVETSEMTREKFKFFADIAPMKNTIENELLPLLQTAIAAGDSDMVEFAGQTFIERMSKGMEDATPRMRATMTGIFSEINKLMDITPGTEKFTLQAQKIITDMENLGISTQEVANNIFALGESTDSSALKLDAIAKSMESFEVKTAAASQAVGDLVSNISQATGLGIADLASRPIGNLEDIQRQIAEREAEGFTVTGGQLIPPSGAGAAPVDMEALNQAEAKIKLIAEAMSLLGPAAQQAAGQMGAAFASIDLTGLTERFRVAFEPLSLIGPATEEAVSQMSTAFTNLDVSGALTALQPLHEALTLLGPATAEAAAQMSQALTQVGTAAQQVGTQMQQAIVTAVQQAASATQQAAQTMISSLQQVAQQAQTTAQSFSQIGQAAQQAASAVQSAAQAMISALEGVVGAAERVAESIRGIGAAAQAAQSDVNSLSDAIRNIPDGEAVIHVSWQVDPAPSGVTGFGVGLGFTRSGTVTYTASGGTGGGITGGIPGGITPAGGNLGGPGEPQLQFGAQHGLGHLGGKDKIKAFNDLGILAPVLVNHPMKMLVGENGPELVSVTPVNRNRTLRSGELSPFVSKTSSRPMASFAHGLGGDGDATIGGSAGFGGTINIGSGTVVFKENQAPVTINNIQQGGGFGTGIGGSTSGGTFAGSTPTSGFGNTTGQGTFNVPGGQVSTMGNAVACVNGQCFGNMSGFGPNIGSPQLGGQNNIPQNAQFQPITNQEGMIDAIETLKEWFKFLGIPLGGIGGAGTTMEDILNNFNPFNKGFGGGFGGMFGGGFGMGGGGATAVAGKGFAMASAGKTTAIAGQPPGGMFGGGLGGGGFGASNPESWRIVMSQGFGGHPVFFVVDERGFPVSQPFMSVEDAQRFIMFAAMSQQQAQQFPQGGTTGGTPGGGQFQNIDIQGNPALLNTPFFNNFFGGQNPFVQGTQNPGTQFTPGTGGQGQINMTGGQINFDQNAGCIDMSTSTGTIAIAGKGGAFAQAGGASASAGFAGSQFGPSPTEQAQLRQFDQLNNNLTNIGNMLGDTNQEFTQFQQTQQDAFFGPTGLLNQQQGGGGGTVFGTGPGQLFQNGNFTGFGQSFQSFPGGGAVGSGTNDPLGFLNSVLGGFGIPTPAGIPTSGTGGGGMTGLPAGTGGGTGGCINLCQGSINAMGGGTLGGGTGGGGTGGGGSVPAPGQTFGGGSEPGFQGGGGSVNNPVGNTPGQFTTGGGASSNPDNWRVMRIEGQWFVVDSAQSNALIQNTPFESEQDAQNFIDVARAQQNQPQQFPTGPTGGQPSGGFGQPTLGGGNQVSISVSQFPNMGGFGGQPGFGGITGPVGNPPVPPRIVQEAGLPSQAPNVNQDPTSWRIVESAGLAGTYDIIDNRGNVVQLGFRTLTDAEAYLNYFLSYYEWVQSGSTGIPGPTPIPGGGLGGGTGGFGGFPAGGTGGFGGGITATAGPASASAGPGGAFASAGNAIAQAFAGAGGSRKMLGPTPVPEMPFEPIPRAQGPFRSGQDNQEPIFDNSGIKIGADFGSPGGTTSMEEVTEGGGGGGTEKGSRFRDRLRRHRAARAAVGGDYAELANAIIDAILEGFSQMGLTIPIGVDLDGNAIYRSQKKFLGNKVSVFS